MGGGDPIVKTTAAELVTRVACLEVGRSRGPVSGGDIRMNVDLLHQHVGLVDQLAGVEKRPPKEGSGADAHASAPDPSVIERSALSRRPRNGCHQMLSEIWLASEHCPLRLLEKRIFARVCAPYTPSAEMPREDCTCWRAERVAGPKSPSTVMFFP